LIDLLTLLREQSEVTANFVGGISADDLIKPTPCAGFDVRGLINHLCLGNHIIARAIAGKEVAPDYETDFVGDDPAGAYERSKDAVLASAAAPGALEKIVHMPFGEVPGAVPLSLALMEAVAHRWDLASATGKDSNVDPQVAMAVLDIVRPMLGNVLGDEQGDPFRPSGDVPGDVSPIDKLVGFLGRNP
jgi:uncharacterized protein (TIGR03086 family)